MIVFFFSFIVGVTAFWMLLRCENEPLEKKIKLLFWSLSNFSLENGLKKKTKNNMALFIHDLLILLE
jgi:hypothetical protein